MKRQLSLLACALAPLCAAAQLTLEHDYPTGQGIEVYEIEGYGHKYVGVENTTKHVMMFNADHSLWKDIPTGIPTDASAYVGVPATRYLFDADANVEVGVVYMPAGGAFPSGYVTRIVNEAGTVIQDFPGVYVANIREVNGAWKLVTTYSPPAPAIGYVKVYALPGTYTTGPKTVNGDGGTSRIYPNPVAHAATVSYKLPEGERTGQLTVCNSAGQVVKTYTVSAMFSDIMIEKGTLPPGIYTYRITSGAHTGDSTKFEIR